MPTSDADAKLIAKSHIELEELVRRRAHEIWQERGGEPGHELDDWLQAEREVLGKSRQSPQDRATVVGSAKVPERW